MRTDLQQNMPLRSANPARDLPQGHGHSLVLSAAAAKFCNMPPAPTDITASSIPGSIYTYPILYNISTPISRHEEALTPMLLHMKVTVQTGPWTITYEVTVHMAGWQAHIPCLHENLSQHTVNFVKMVGRCTKMCYCKLIKFWALHVW